LVDEPFGQLFCAHPLCCDKMAHLYQAVYHNYYVLENPVLPSHGGSGVM
jgi:hypothetical protein